MQALIEIRAAERQDVQGMSGRRYSGPKAIIVAPTKELANQIAHEGRKLASKTGIKITQMKKGMRLAYSEEPSDERAEEEAESAEEQSNSDADEDDSTKPRRPYRGPIVKSDIIVSTPLLLLNSINATSTNPLETVRFLVLDEADVLLDPLFRAQTLSIWTRCTNPLLRASLWSATIGSSIESLATQTIASRHSTIPNSLTRPPLLRLVIGLKDTALPTITHTLTYCATEAGKLLALRQLLRPNLPRSESTAKSPTLRPPFLVFTQTIPRALALHAELRYDIPPEAGGSARIGVLHAEMSDSARDAVMKGFRKGEVWVLITTDLLARGVDFRGLNGVVNYDVPNSGAAYVHRVGRTGRAGREGGVAVTLYTKEDVPFVKHVANVIAASERQRRRDDAIKSGRPGAGGEGAEGKEEQGQGGGGIQQWLLDALPTPSKRDKQNLKRHGNESRRKGKESVKTRISTKSGFERRVENNRKGARSAPQKRGERPRAKSGNVEGGETDFQGFD